MTPLLASAAPEGKVVLTGLRNDDGSFRNVQSLKRVGNLWFIPDGSMYVYYTPTHYWPVAGGSK